jgi:hypothetical protein
MKGVCLTIVLLMSEGCALAQRSSDLIGEGLKGRVKTVTETQYCNAPGKPCMRTVDKYDAKGNLTEEVQNDYALNLDSRKFFRYDTNTNGSIVRLNEVGDSAIVTREVDYKYDSLNHLAETNDYRTFGERKVVYRSEYSYDDKGRKVTEKHFTNDDLDYVTDYTYDTKERMTLAKSRDKKEKVTMLYDYNYLGSTDQWIHCEKMVAGIQTHIFKMIDTAGLVLEKTTYVADYSKQTTESFSGFDKAGNWLKDIVKGVENYMVTRLIEYYK